MQYINIEIKNHFLITKYYLITGNDLYAMSQNTLPCTPPPQNCYKEKPVLFRVIQVKRPKIVFFQHIHSNPILINLAFLDNNE